MSANSSLPAIAGEIEELSELCRRFNVKRLEVFGSAATAAFSDSSDLDFVVDFGDQPLACIDHKSFVVPTQLRRIG